MLYMLIIALSPVLALIIYVYQKDRYDREPPLFLFKLFFYGCLIVIPVYFIERILSEFNYYNSSFYQAFIVAGLTEEFFKYITLRKIALKSVHYNEKLDGIVYSVFVSLGFAAIENIIYVLFRSNNYLYVGFTRAIFAVPAHMLFAITMGYYISLSKFSRENTKLNDIKALIMPIILHGSYNYILMSGLYSLFGIFIVYVIYIWRINMIKLNRYTIESRKNSR